MAHRSVPSPVGVLTVFSEEGTVVALEWGHSAPGDPDPLLDEAARQLAEYFAGARRDFDLPLKPPGGIHEQAVWAEMRKIPFGGQLTYGDLAARIGSVARAVGGACGRNPIPVIIPCHRVVGTGGRMTGFSGGAGVETKEWLLRHEGALLI